MKGSGIVTSVRGNKARVKVTTASDCGGCPSKSICHPHEGGGEREITVVNAVNAREADHVVFEAPEGMVILSAALIWILPIAAMMVGYFVARRFSTGFIPILSAFLFLGCAFILLRIIDATVSGGLAFYPTITGVVRDGHCPVLEK